ncbi:hypothetical protein GCM10023186_38020 [Hymenobacter koreensis]|uniref:histidine kinase n=1 Tax=Hymenobacter koreensis TaxID=1084523 RepID=A0ABP8JG64_9BACT
MPTWLPFDEMLCEVLNVSMTGLIFYLPIYDPAGSGDIVDFSFEYLNPTAQRMMHMPARPTLTHNEQWPHSREHGTFAFHVDAYVTGEPRSYNINYQADGYDNYYRLTARRAGKGLLVSFTDTADQPRTPVEVALRESQVRERQARAEAEQQRNELRDFVEHAPVAVAVYRGPQYIVELANATTLAIWGRSLPDVLGRPVFEVLPEAAAPSVVAIFDQVFTTGTPYTAHEQHTIINRHGRSEVVYWNFVFQPEFQPDGSVIGIRSVGTEVTEQVRARRQVEQLNQELEARVQERTEQVREQSQRLERLFMQAPAAICIVGGPELVFELVNPIYQQFFPERQLLGKPLQKALPELADHAVYHSMRQVYETGETSWQQALHTPLTRATDGVLEDRYFTYVQQPRYDEQGRIDGVLVFGFEVTELVQARQQADALQAEVLAVAQRQVQERETFYQIFEQTPACIALLRGPEHRFEYVNAAYQQLFPGRQLLGLPLRKALPETEAQGFVAWMNNVYQTGETFFGTEILLTIDQADGQPALDKYFTFTYQAYKENGTVAGISIFAYDVSEQVRARQERETQQRKFYTLFEEAPVGLCIFVGPDLVYEFVNESYKRLLPGRVLLGRPLLEVMPELAGTDVERLLRQVYETGETQQEQAFLIPIARVDENGQPGALEDRYFTFVYQARRDEQGRVNGILNFALEVTEQVQAWKRVEDSSEELKRFKFMADQARDPFILTRADGSFAYLNQRALEAWGYTAEEMAGLRVPDVDLIYQEDSFGQLFTQAQQEAIPLFETIHRRKDGYVYPVEISATGLQLDGQPHLLVVARDITEQQRFVAALQESEARFRTMADAAPNMVWAVNPDSSIRYINRAFLDFVGLQTEQEYMATGWRLYLHPDELELTQQTLSVAIGRRQPYIVEHRMRRHDGQYRWLLAQGAPSYLPGGELYGYVGSAIDITELKQANEQLRRTNVDLDNFIYTASHDLKAPISNIEGLLYLLREELPAEAAQNGYVEATLTRMLDAVERFKRTIEHLTDVSRLQKEHAPVTMSVDLARVVEAVRLDLAPLLEESRAQLHLDVSGVPAVLIAEKNLRSVVFNLLSNALKYRSPAREPSIHVQARVEGNYTVLEVHDNGLGLSETHLPRLFTMFQRFHDHVEGSGVGLFMVKRMVENAGGRIEVRSQLGTGTTFSVALPHALGASA